MSLTNGEKTEIVKFVRDQEVPRDRGNELSGNDRAIELGKKLFFSQQLSSNGMACATCHSPSFAWADGLVSRPRGDVDFGRNTPSLENAGFQNWYSWDGRADSIWSQAIRVIENPSEFGIDRTSLLRRLDADVELRGSYAKLFGPLPPVPSECATPAWSGSRCERGWQNVSAADQDAINAALVNVAKALGAFVSTIKSPQTRFDAFLVALRNNSKRATDHLTEKELLGLRLFVGRAQCNGCHSGPQLSDREFHDLRLRGGASNDNGRYEAVLALRNDPFNLEGKFAGPLEDRTVRTSQLRATPDLYRSFRTPSLRGVSRSAPYMHTGKFASLRAVVEFYSTLENTIPMHHGDPLVFPRNLNDSEKDQLIAFLEIL